MLDYTSARANATNKNIVKNENIINNETNNYTSITRQKEMSHFKKIRIHSQEFSLITNNTPLVYRYYKQETHMCLFDEIPSNISYKIYYQEVKPLCFNRISNDEMLVEYEILSEKILNLDISCFYDCIQHCYIMPSEKEVLSEVMEELFEISK